jgi:hypothetical protein
VNWRARQFLLALCALMVLVGVIYLLGYWTYTNDWLGMSQS